VSALPNLYHVERGWRRHDGGACPVDPSVRALLQFACGKVSEGERLAKHFIWQRRGWDFDIVAYQIVGIEGAQ
jgi:hypothetical protein